MNTYNMTRSPIDEAVQSDDYTIKANLLPHTWWTEVDKLILANLECSQDLYGDDSDAYLRSLNL